MGFFDRNRPPGSVRVSDKLEAARTFPTEEVKDALGHVLRLLAKASTLQDGTDDFRTMTVRAARELERATLPEDFESAAQSVRALKLPIKIEGDAETVGIRNALRAAVEAAIPVAKALGQEGPVLGLQRLREALKDARIDSTVQSDFAAHMEHIADAVHWLRQMCDSLKSSVAEVIDTLGKLASDEPAVQHRLKSIRDRVVASSDIHELEQLRGVLLTAANALVDEAQARSGRVGVVRTRVLRTQAQVGRLEAAVADAKTMALTDPLTGLGNRRALEAASHSCAKSAQTTGVLAIDIDRFKNVNDAHGQELGDGVLRYMADAVRGELKGDEKGFRVGGEEFLVLLPGLKLDDACASAERIRARVASEPAIASDPPVTVTVSIGVTEWVAGTSFDVVVTRANKALADAKRTGRDRVVTFR